MSDRSSNASAGEWQQDAGRYIEARFPTWWEQHLEDMKQLITEFSDEAALEMFERLRERFWSRL
jgi:hypothetical protein